MSIVQIHIDPTLALDVLIFKKKSSFVIKLKEKTPHKV